MDREKVIKEWETVLSRDPLDAPWDLIDDTLALLKEQEAVVRCKDCEQNGQCSIQFKFAESDDPGNWFCAYGKRKEGR